MIVDGACDGYYNMAVDESLLTCYQCAQIPTLRLYGWNAPFVSLGYNQHVEQVLRSYTLPFVRRITGGSGILHHDELTYSIVCATSDIVLPKKVKESYAALCSFLKTFYARLGLDTVFAKDIISQGLGRHEHFCFSACEPFDLMVKGKKIGGNAQRRSKETIFQHGSIPFSIDFKLVQEIFMQVEDVSTKTTCLNEIRKEGNDFLALRDMLAESFRSTFAVELFEDILSKEEKATAQYLLENKYRNKEWNYRRAYNEKAEVV